MKRIRVKKQRIDDYKIILLYFLTITYTENEITTKKLLGEEYNKIIKDNKKQLQISSNICFILDIYKVISKINKNYPEIDMLFRGFMWEKGDTVSRIKFLRSVISYLEKREYDTREGLLDSIENKNAIKIIKEIINRITGNHGKL